MTITRINPQKWTAPIEVSASNVERNVPPSSNTWPRIIQLEDKNGNLIGYLTTPFHTDGKEGVQLETSRTVNGSNVYNGIQLYIDSSGTRTVALSDPAAWRSGMGADNADNLTTGTLPDARFSSGSTTVSRSSTYTSGGTIYLTKRGKTVQVNAAGIAFKSFTGRQVVGTIPSGYRPADTAYLVFNGSTKYLILNTNGNVQYDGEGATATRYGSTSYVIP